MGFQELRQHLRVQTEGKAIIQLGDSARIRCALHDMSLGGAYLIRSTEFGPPAEMSIGEMVVVTMFNAEDGGSYELDAEIVRLEPLGGAGVAVRWRHDEVGLHAFETHIKWEAQNKAIAPTSLGIAVLDPVGREVFKSAERITRFVVPAAALLIAGGFISVGVVWIKTVFGGG